MVDSCESVGNVGTEQHKLGQKLTPILTNSISKKISDAVNVVIIVESEYYYCFFLKKESIDFMPLVLTFFKLCTFLDS